jgi:sugar lactone lactonase YvrE
MTADLLLDARATLGEGPVWHPRFQQLLWVDIEGHAVHVTDPDGPQDRVIHVGEQIGCLAPAGDDLIVMGLRSGFAVMDLATGQRAHIEDPELHLPENRFNDGKCDPHGRFWAGTMHESGETPDRGSLYCLDTDLRVTCKVPGVSISNGLAWSLDHRTMYYVDSPTHQIVAYEYDLNTGTIRHSQLVYSVPHGGGSPDGMTIDTDGHLWLALWDGHAVVRIDPTAGTVVDRIDLPVSRPSSCTFGGAALDELYITSARQNLPLDQLGREPQAGGVFVCRPRAQGLPAVEFGGADKLRLLLRM